MKSIKLVLLIAVLAIAGSVRAKDEIKTDTTYFSISGGSSFDAYEPVLLKGTYNVQLVKKIEGNYELNGEKHSVDVIYYNGSWSSSIGSFLPNQSIILNFDVQVQADLEKITELRALFVEKFNVTLDSLVNNFTPEDKEISIFQKKLIKELNKQLPSSEFDKFKDEKGKSLRERLTEKLMDEKTLETLSKLNLEIKRSNTIIKDNLSAVDKELTKQTGKEYSALKNYVDFFKNPESVKNGKPIPDSEIDSTNPLYDCIGRIDTSWSDLVKETSNRDKLILEIIPEAGTLIKMSFQSRLKNTKELTFALKNFIGFDLMPAHFLDKGPNSTFGLFFTASPYFGKTDPDEKIFQKGDSCGNFRRFITPTIGIGLTSSPKSNKIAPLVYAGIGFRISNIVRISIGKTFYTRKYEVSETITEPTIEQGNCWTIGIGLSTDYLSDFMKIFSTTVNQYGKK